MLPNPCRIQGDCLADLLEKQAVVLGVCYPKTISAPCLHLNIKRKLLETLAKISGNA